MRSRSFASTLSLTALFLAGLAACGGDDATTQAPSTPPATAAATTPAAPATTSSPATTRAPTTTTPDLPGAVIRYLGDFASPYCVTARNWVATGEPDYGDGPEGLRAYFADYRAFVDQATAHAPTEIAADWALVATAQVQLTAVLEKYGYDEARFEAEASEEERAVLEAPPADVDEAQQNFHRYEAEVCRAGELLPAEITYTGDADSEFCRLLDGDPPSDAPAVELEEFITGGAMAQLAADRLAVAPSEVASDISVHDAWRAEWFPKVLSAHGWSLAQAIRDGTEEELIALTFQAPEVRDANARVTAYALQVCEQ